LVEGSEREGAPLPRFFVSVASKGVRVAVSLLFATLAGRSISVAAKGFTFPSARRGRALDARERLLDGKAVKELEPGSFAGWKV
jgi:hypothetical protein